MTIISLFHIIALNNRLLAPITDTIPPCINAIERETGRILSKFDYKGQYWFSFTNEADTIENNNSDKMTTRVFYNANCKVVARWQKGGIAGLNKIIPDTIQKEKIITISVHTLDAVVVKKMQTPLTLPDSVAKMALRKNSRWVEENNFDGKSIYRLQNPADNPNTSKVTFVHPYYYDNGKVAIAGKPTGRTFWWHNVNGKFLRTQFQPGYR